MEPPEYAAADAETRGLHAALTRACALEARLRSAVQASHPISSSLELDPSSADREREALLATRCGRAGGRRARTNSARCGARGGRAAPSKCQPSPPLISQ